MTGAIDRVAGIIKGVSVITTGVAKGHNRLIDQTTLSQIHGLMSAFPDGTKVKANHFSGFEGIVGNLRSPRIEGDQLKADLHILQSHEMAGLIMEMSEKQPSTFGLSVSFSGVPEEKEKLLYARAAELYSVDLVDDPAANPSGLFSAVDFSQSLKTKEPMITAFKEFLGLARDMEKPLRDELTQLTTRLNAIVAEKAELQEKIDGHATELSAKDSEITKLQTDLKTAQDTIKDPKGEITRLASLKAREQLSALGHAPVDLPPDHKPGDDDAVLEEYNSIKSPVERVRWYQKKENAERYDAAFRRKNSQS